MGVDNVTSGSSTSAVPPADTGEAPLETGDQGTTTEVPPDESVPAEAMPEGTGEPPAEETPTSGEATITSDSESYSYSTNEPPTSTNTTADSSGLPGAQEGETVDDWFARQIEAANQGDETALKNLQTFMEAPVQETETLAEQLKSQDQFTDDEGKAKQEKYYDEAILKSDLNALLARTAREKALTLPKDSPIRQDLFKKADQLMAANRKLSQQVEKYEKNRADRQAADAKKQLDAQVFKSKPLVSIEGYLPKSGPAMKITSGGLVKTADGKLLDPSKVQDKKGKTDSKSASTTTAPTKKGKDVSKGKEVARETVDAPTDEQVAMAEKAVGTVIPEDVRKERLARHREKAAVMAWSKGAKGELGSGKATGKAAIYRGFMGAAFGELESGKNGMVAGLRFLTGKAEEGFEKLKEGAEAGVRAAVHGVQTAVQGVKSRVSHTVSAFSGKREDVEKGWAALNQNPTSFRDSLEPGKGGFIHGYGWQNWIPHDQRGETYGSDLRMRDMGVA